MLIDKKTDFDKDKLTFSEDQGFTIREAIAEAKRCLNCPRPLCRTGCPIDNDIPGFVSCVAQGNFGQASKIIAQRSSLPAVCGRVCPHEKQCEAHCVMTKQQKGIRIGKLERFVADFESDMEVDRITPTQATKGSVAVIGSGPAGLTVAGDLAKAGFAVTVFEGQNEPGGVLLYGIPAFRLNKDVVRREIDRLKQLGILFETNVLVGQDITADQIFDRGFDAIFIGTGTALPRTLEVPGKDLPGVVQATYFLSMVALAAGGNLDQKEVPVAKGDRVVVIGAGNVAIDAARTALRLGAQRVTIVYRRTQTEMPALQSEYEQAVAEGVQFEWLASPTAFTGGERVRGVEYELQKIDANGKPTPSCQLRILPADKVIMAVGQRPAARIVSTTTGIDVNENGYVITKERPYGMTTRRGVFAGGDVVHEPATVVLAMKEAKKAAAGIASYIEAKKLLDDCEPVPASGDPAQAQ
ncbi:NAD(P)-dependent oxidoreductase [Acetonema longum]|uniref:Glutamate synthase (Nadph) beta chain, putative n=1 Tax=Acetonema longum DSM 6540 TaxID=1009370 RepID=F7NMN9_9FIRM|nr:NAD(P)-dependent oxidoreductase [Acetonema longum]EGO62703.1 glutamate synthase (nadph) beta chain, putative [Acetonema longum DSM 6540]